MCTKEDYLKGHKASGIKVGDTVRVVREARDGEKGWGNVWNNSMNEFIGKEVKVTRDSDTHGFTLDTKPVRNFPFFVLEKVTNCKEQSSEKFYDDCGVELLPGDVVAVWDSQKRNTLRVFREKTKEGHYLIFCDGYRDNFKEQDTIVYNHAEFYARPPAKQKYVRSRKEVAQILLDNGYEPSEEGTWWKDDDCFFAPCFKDCGKKYRNSSYTWDEKFLEER